MAGGRVIFGSGPGALPSDAHTLAIDPMAASAGGGPDLGQPLDEGPGHHPAGDAMAR